jgi:hypothetical protein
MSLPKRIWSWNSGDSNNRYDWPFLKAKIKRAVANKQNTLVCLENTGMGIMDDCDIDEYDEPDCVNLYDDGTIKVLFI